MYVVTLKEWPNVDILIGSSSVMKGYNCVINSSGPCADHLSPYEALYNVMRILWP